MMPKVGVMTKVVMMTKAVAHDWAYILFDWDNIFASFMLGLDAGGKGYAYTRRSKTAAASGAARDASRGSRGRGTARGVREDEQPPPPPPPPGVWQECSASTSHSPRMVGGQCWRTRPAHTAASWASSLAPTGL
jgi:hypothetical protein